MIRRATVETLDDIVNSIKSFGDVEIKPNLDSGGVKIEAWPYIIKIEQHEALYHWTIRAKDDPSDGDEGSASDPLSEIKDFLSEGAPGRELWEQVASSPKKLAAFLRKLAASPEDPKTVKALKRIAAFLKRSDASNPGLKMLLELHKSMIDKLVVKMESKGWKAEAVEDDSGLPAVIYEIGETYEGKIMFSQVMYEYEFSVEGDPGVTKKGISDTVTEDLKMWLNDPDVAAADDAIGTDRQTFKAVTGRPTQR